MVLCDESLWQEHVSQKAQWWAMAFIYMLTSLYGITGPGWHKSNSVKLQRSTRFLYYTSEDGGAWDWKANSQRAASSMASHSTRLIWKCRCAKHVGHTLLGTGLLGPLHWESTLWRKAFPDRQVFTHNLMLKWEFGTAWSAEEYHVSVADR